MMIPRFSPATTPMESARFIMDIVNPTARRRDAIDHFEGAFAHWQRVPHVLFVSSGRMGLYLILAAAGYPRGAEVVVPAFTYFAIPAMLRYMGLEVVYADVEPTTYEISATTVRGSESFLMFPSV